MAKYGIIETNTDTNETVQFLPHLEKFNSYTLADMERYRLQRSAERNGQPYKYSVVEQLI